MFLQSKKLSLKNLSFCLFFRPADVKNASFRMLTVPKSIRVEPCASELLIMFAKSNKNNKNSPVHSEIVGKGQIEKTSAKKSVGAVVFSPDSTSLIFTFPF